MGWYNSVTPHGALDLKTSVEAYCSKMPNADEIMYPASMEESS
jgi:hypothetical protein